MKKYFFVVATSFAFLYVASTFLAVSNAQTTSPTPTATAYPSTSSVPSVTPTPTPSSEPTKLSGWGWSSNIGWINLSTVNIIRPSGYLDGYAWSSNIGWVRFGGLSSFPSGGTPSTNAKVDLYTGAVTGWARACAGTVNNSPNQNLPGDCSSMTSRTDGWDGWIELSGTNHTNTAMSLSTGVINGYAWGGPVVGWVGLGNVAAPVQQALAATCSGSLVGLTVTFTGSASGGSGTIQYSWNGSSYSSVNSTYSKAQTPPLTTATFSVKDSTNVPVSATCNYPANGSGTTITGSCTVLPTVANINDSVTIGTKTLIGGTGSYVSYLWYTGIGTQLTNSNTYSLSYPKDGTYSTAVKVTDSNGNFGNISCAPNLKVIDPNNKLKLYIGDTGASGANIAQTYYHVRAGGRFGLEWSNEFANDPTYSCDAGGSLNTETKFSDWTSSNPTSSGDKNYTGSETLNVPTGKYDFTITCSKGATSFSTKAILDIYTVSQGEM